MRTVGMGNYKPMLKEKYMDFGMDKKKQLRKMAMDKMMKDGPAIAIKIQEKKMMGPKDPMDKGKSEEMGMVSMMVTPEEKKMLEMHRGGSEDESEDSMEDSMEGEMEEPNMLEEKAGKFPFKQKKMGY